MSRTRFIATIALAGLLPTMLAACGGSSSETSPATSETSIVTTSLPPSTTASLNVSTTQMSQPEPEPLTFLDLPPGDPANGAVLFEEGMAVRFRDSCSTCHSASGEAQGYGNLLDGMGVNAGLRVEGLGAEEYVFQSIVDPDAYAVEGWDLHMPDNYGKILSAQDIADLIAFVLEQ